VRRRKPTDDRSRLADAFLTTHGHRPHDARNIHLHQDLTIPSDVTMDFSAIGELCVPD
jgi:hypothetical protein